MHWSFFGDIQVTASYRFILSEVHTQAPAMGIYFLPRMLDIARLRSDHNRVSGWATPKTGRIVALNLLNALRIRSFNGTESLEFNLFSRGRTENETLAYSCRLMTGFNSA